MPLRDKAIYDAVRSKEDFYELFRNWELKEMVPEEYTALRELAYERPGPLNMDEMGYRIPNQMADINAATKELKDFITNMAIQTSKIQSKNVWIEGEDQDRDMREIKRQYLLKEEANF